MSAEVESANSLHSNAQPRMPLLAIALGIGLNHTTVLFGFNLSAADVIAVLLLIAALLSNRLYLPKWPLLFFLALLAHLILVGAFITPAVFSVPISLASSLGDLVKLLTAFLYFILGVYIVRTHQIASAIRAFVITATCIGLLAIVQTTIPGVPRLDFLFFGELRFLGLMNDPNYFSVIQIVALAMLLHYREIAKKFRVPSFIILSLSVLLSGSKTGAITLFVFFAYRLIVSLSSSFKQRNTRPVILKIALIPAILSCFVALLVNPVWRFQFADYLNEIPGLSRVATLLVDFESSVSTGGSGRDNTWTTALSIIEASPVLGVGLGTYLPVGAHLTGYRGLAHNTFLQLAAEWGLPLAILFFTGVAILIFKKPVDATHLRLWRATRDGLLVMLVGSIGISLNNARIFWLMLGVVLAMHIFTIVSENPAKNSRQKKRKLNETDFCC